MQQVQKFTDLGFVRTQDEKVSSMWAPESSGVYALDNKIGRTHADQCVDLMRREDNPNLLNHVMRDMVEGGQYGGIEVGFVTRVARHTIGYN
jgi:hypothetical protein